MSAPSPAVSVVIPAFNRREGILQLLADLVRQEGVALEIIIVDDHSTDDTVAAVVAAFPQVRVLRNLLNAGPAVSRNRGVRAARAPIVVGFDSDVTVPDRTLLRRVLEEFERRSEVTGLAFRLLAADGRSDDEPRWWHPLPLDRYANASFATHYFSGTGYAFRRAEMIAAGLFPEILYMHYEEVELAYRVLDAGGTLLYCPHLTVVHHAHPVATRSKIKVFYKPRNQILVALACYPWLRAIGYVVPRLGYHFLQACVHRHLGEFVSVLRSAARLAPRRLASRAPVRAQTWKRIAKMHRGRDFLSPSPSA